MRVHSENLLPRKALEVPGISNETDAVSRGNFGMRHVPHTNARRQEEKKDDPIKVEMSRAPLKPGVLGVQ
jgi:hypothetical protein